MRQRAGFLYVAYRKSLYYWDAVLAARRVLVLLIAQLAVGSPRFQLLGWIGLGMACLTLQLIVRQFDSRNMDILNRTEVRGLILWIVSVYLIMLVMVRDVNDIVTTALIIFVMLANLAHYIILVVHVCKHGLSRSDFVMRWSMRRKHRAWLEWFVDCVSWLVHREEKQRKLLPSVSYDWRTAQLSLVDSLAEAINRADDAGNTATSCSLFGGRPAVRKGIAAVQMTCAALEEAVQVLQMKQIPSDL
ncbi:unnamed protein product [Vitrella brassicaformis CCMP3155]|uniref:TRP C-terminal domain-containing protein n=1 Tax=Vitrella brassicaformis (strain CCMP3155) TaxID=1169540 RepID=A0A0G4GZ67_VITBC|nr:unnamed protein product [Vitrella brassicaformis CCMP3155]|eukprot:CEM36459.1 unnamed protein product [Vitrella brassicaformis CCMP3155]